MFHSVCKDKDEFNNILTYRKNSDPISSPLSTIPCDSLIHSNIHSPFASHECFHQGGHQFLLVTLSSHLIDKAQAFRCHILTQL